jgi:dienelactone hydrolase
VTRTFIVRLALAAALAVSAAMALPAAPARAETLHREQFFIPMKAAGSIGLEALLIRPDGPSKYPLVLISHGVAGKRSEREALTPWRHHAAAVEFARRGWAALIVMRRGYGRSGGWAENTGSCEKPDYISAAIATSFDLKAAIEAAGRRPDIDTSRILAVGQSGGGMATIALAASPPPGLRAAISFAGGRGGTKDYRICNEDRLVAAFGYFGKKVRIPMLWVYAENDRRFAPALARKFLAAYQSGGAPVVFEPAPAFAKDGHSLFSLQGIPIWTHYVDVFLAKHELTWRKTLLPLPMPAGFTPPRMSGKARKTFEDYLRAGQHKAFAANGKGSYGWVGGRPTVDEATRGALALCNKHSQNCQMILVDDEVAPEGAKP